MEIFLTTRRLLGVALWAVFARSGEALVAAGPAVLPRVGRCIIWEAETGRMRREEIKNIKKRLRTVSRAVFLTSGSFSGKGLGCSAVFTL
jgi:hypothetical protein